LRKAEAIPEIDKDQSPVIAATMYPSREGHNLASIIGPQLTAVVRLEHGPSLPSAPRTLMDYR